MKRDKICLVTPPSIFLLDERVFPNIGILKVASSLESRGYPVEMLDLSGISNYEDALEAHTRQTDAVWFGITATTPQMPAAHRILGVIRRNRPDTKVMIGGPHVTLVAAASKTSRGSSAMTQLLGEYDCVVAGDGEDAVFQALESGERFVDADDPKSSLFMTNTRYDATPMPARHLVDLDSYHYSIEGVRATSLIAQLGCPFGCGFCGGRASPMLRKIRTRTTQSIVDELRHLYTAYGYRGFMFYDDELNVNKQVVELMDAITELQKELGVEFRLRGFVKAELFTDAQARSMYSAGFRWLLTGFESGSPRILENINKRATREDNDGCVDIARRNGLKVKALMSVGHPGESAGTVMETRDWLINVKPDDFDVTVITTYPGTPYYDQAVKTEWVDERNVWTYTCPKSGDRLHSLELDYNVVADYYKGDPNGGYQAYVFTDHLDRDQIVKLRDFVEGDVRKTLQIPFNPGAPGIRFEHSMGMGQLPTNILRSSSYISTSPTRLRVVE